MRFKVLKGTPTFDRLSTIAHRCHECKSAADDLAREIGAENFSQASKISGGINAFCFNEKPEGWKLVHAPDFYFPKAIKANEELLAKINALPQVDTAEFNNAIGFKKQSFRQKGVDRWINSPGAKWGDDYHLIDIPNGCTFEAGPDFIQIKKSEWLALQGK